MIQAVDFYCETTETRLAINRAVDPKILILILSEQIVKNVALIIHNIINNIHLHYI